MDHDRKNIMVILSSPSGVGKTTICRKILQKYKSFKLSVSLTTRQPRSNEVDGVDYFFTTKENFEKLITKDFKISETYTLEFNKNRFIYILEKKV